MNPIYQNTKMAIGATEAEMAEVRSQIGNQRAQIEQLRGMIDRIPQVEAELEAAGPQLRRQQAPVRFAGAAT
jgi:uncharacterized membrane protein